MGKKEGEAASVVPATGVLLPPIDVGGTGFPQFPFDPMSRTIFSPYSLYHLLQRLQKKAKQLQRGKDREIGKKGEGIGPIKNGRASTVAGEARRRTRT